MKKEVSLPYPVLSTHLRLGLPSGLFPSGFPTNNLYAFLFSPIRATWPSNFILRDLIILIILGRTLIAFVFLCIKFFNILLKYLNVKMVVEIIKIMYVI
jgi:hypothetical protein